MRLDVCEHGTLRRKCALCDALADVATAKAEGAQAVLDIVRGQIASIRRIASEPAMTDIGRELAAVRIDALEGVLLAALKEDE